MGSRSDAQELSKMSTTDQSGSNRCTGDHIANPGLLVELHEAAKNGDRRREENLLANVRGVKAIEEVRKLLDGMLAHEGLHQINEQMPKGYDRDDELDHEIQQSRPRFMDIRYLCRRIPFKVPAKPWTTVTDSDDLVSHLVSLYLTWGYPFYAFFCRDTFLKHMSEGNPNSDFCSPFLVNALLANACHYSDYSEAYSLPGDIKSKGAHFLAEAESCLMKHQLEGRGEIRLSSLQATLLLYERYSLLGSDDHGYTMLHRAISMAESLGIVNSAQMIDLGDSNYSIDMQRSLNRTAWGLFQVDTLVHMNFLRKSLIKTVNVARIPADQDQIEDMWVPYPLEADPQQSYMSIYFDEASKLSSIARDTSWEILDASPTRNLKKKLYERLCEWERNLPRQLSSDVKPAPYIIILRMRYHTIIINLCCHDLQPNMASVKFNKSTPDLGSSNSEPAAIVTAISSARAIASLVRKFRRWYMLEHIHQFAMYAISVSLFCLMARDGFDVFDPDFLSLTKAFSIIACRSCVGRHLFHAFKRSVRSRLRETQAQNLDCLPSSLRDFFAPRENIHEPDKWDHYAEGLGEAYGDGTFLKDIEKDPMVLGLNDMLRWYERLSIGKEIRRIDRSHQPDF